MDFLQSPHGTPQMSTFEFDKLQKLTHTSPAHPALADYFQVDILRLLAEMNLLAFSEEAGWHGFDDKDAHVPRDAHPSLPRRRHRVQLRAPSSIRKTDIYI